MRDIDHISVSVDPPVTRDYRLDRNGTVMPSAGFWFNESIVKNKNKNHINRETKKFNPLNTGTVAQVSSDYLYHHNKLFHNQVTLFTFNILETGLPGGPSVFKNTDLNAKGLVCEASAF